MPTFGELLNQYIERAGITDAELARSTGVQRQTIFRWKEGLTARPRYREDVLRIAAKLRLSPAERDALLLAGGFSPDDPATVAALFATPGDELTQDGARGEGQAVDGATSDDDPTALAVDEYLDTQLVAFSVPQPTATDVMATPLSTPLPTPLPMPRRRNRLIERPQLMLSVVVVLMLAVALAGTWLLPAIFPPTPPATIVAVVSPAPSATPPPTATPTPIVAQPGEQLIVIAPFVGYTSSDLRFNVAGRIREAVEEELQRAQLDDVHTVIWPEPIAEPAQADAVLAEAGAVLAIWGEYDAGRVRAGVTALALDDTYWVNPVDAPSALPLVINQEVPRDARIFALYTLGSYFRSVDEPIKALAVFERALAQAPTDATTRATLHFYVGLLAPQLQGYTPQTLTRAIEHYSAALALQPAWENVRYNRGTTYLGRALLSLDERADLDAAVADLSMVIERKPARVDPLVNRGIAYYQRNGDDDLERARTDFARVIELQPKDHRGYYHRALVAIRSGDAAGWQADLTRVQELAPAYTPASNALCWGYGTAGDAGAALPYCDAAVAADTSGASFDSRAITLAQLGRYAEAAADLRAYLDWVRATYPALYPKYRGPQAEGWIELLDLNENPFTPEVLEVLRKG
jgi:tetratricopeptide (TPR) repeat protein/transcriptional regulator with XRE-family HTH domain